MEIRRGTHFAPEPSAARAIHIADFRVEIGTDVCVGGVHASDFALPIAAEVKRVCVFARQSTVSRRGLPAEFARFKRACPEPAEIHLARGTIDKIDAGRAVVSVEILLINSNYTQARPCEQIALDAQNGVVRPINIHGVQMFRSSGCMFIRENVQQSYTEASHFTGNLSTRHDWDGVSFRNADTATVEKEERGRGIETRPRDTEIE